MMDTLYKYNIWHKLTFIYIVPEVLSA